jgi:hypothetical protein
VPGFYVVCSCMLQQALLLYIKESLTTDGGGEHVPGSLWCACARFTVVCMCQVCCGVHVPGSLWCACARFAVVCMCQVHCGVHVPGLLWCACARFTVVCMCQVHCGVHVPGLLWCACARFTVVCMCQVYCGVFVAADQAGCMQHFTWRRRSPQAEEVSWPCAIWHAYCAVFAHMRCWTRLPYQAGGGRLPSCLTHICICDSLCHNTHVRLLSTISMPFAS